MPNHGRDDRDEIQITIVHDDTDAVKLCIKDLRTNLANVEPAVSFESCCLWEFQEDVFHKKQNLLVILSKKTVTFCKTVYALVLKQQRMFLASPTRVCVVIETTSQFIPKRFEELLATNTVACVNDLFDIFSWFPKVAIFAFPPDKSRMYLQKCVIPKIEDDEKLDIYRWSLMSTLRDLDVSVATELDKISSIRCGFLFRMSKEDPLAGGIRKVVNKCVKRGAQIVEHVIHYEDKRRFRRKKRVTYGNNNQLLFVLHVLYIIGLVDIKAIKKRGCRRRLTKGEAIRENIDSPDVTGCIVLSFLNPGLILYFFTPLPYVVYIVCKLTGMKQLWTICLIFWMIISLLCIYGISFYYLAKADVLAYAMAGFWLLVICSSVCTFMIVRTLAGMFNKLWDLDLI